MSYPFNSQVDLQVTTRDSTGALVNATTVSIVITLPDGTSITLTLAGGGIVTTGTGTYVAYYVSPQTGWHQWSGASTGPVTSYGPDSFMVIGATATATYAPMVSLKEIREHLSTGTTVTDAKLLRLGLVASELCESRDGTGKVWRRSTHTEIHDGAGQRSLLLRKLPVLSITSVSENGNTLTPVSDYTPDLEAGLLHRGSTLAPISWLYGQENITLTYVAGTAGAIPEPVRHGVLELVRHMFDTQRGGSNLPRQSGTDGDGWDPRLSYTIPRRVLELWGPYKFRGTGA